MRLCLIAACGVLLSTSVLLGCAGKALIEPEAHGGGGASAGNRGVFGGASNALGGTANAGVGNDSSVNGGVANGGADAFGGAAGAVVIGDGGEGGTAQAPSLAGAWDLTVTAKFTQFSDPPPSPFVLSLFCDEIGNIASTLSKDGELSMFTLGRLDGLHPTITRPDSGARLTLVGRAPDTALVLLKGLALDGFDDDGDGLADRLEGSGEGSLEQSCGDCTYSKAVALKLIGVRDRTPPSLQVPPSLNPIDPLLIRPSEALRTAALTLAGSNKLPIEASTNNPMTSITYTANSVLPFSRSWKITGHGEDFAGLPLDLSKLQVTTVADPGVFAQDGFEANPKGTLSGGAAWVDSSSGLPIPSGVGALFLPPGGSVTLHLLRTNGLPRLSAKVVNLSTAKTERGNLNFEAAVIGGRERFQKSSVLLAGTLATNHPTWTHASNPSAVSLDTFTNGTDIVVRLTAEACTGGPCPEPGALLVDDLEFE